MVAINIDMPKNCSECPFRKNILDDNMCSMDLFINHHTKWLGYGEGLESLPELCPLIDTDQVHIIRSGTSIKRRNKQ